MAISTTVSIRNAANQYIPSDYVPATLPALTDPQKVQDSTTITASLVDGVDEATTLGNIVTQLTTYLNTSYYPNILKLDAAKTITANIDVFKIERIRTANDLVSGTEQMSITFIASWE